MRDKGGTMGHKSGQIEDKSGPNGRQMGKKWGRAWFLAISSAWVIERVTC